MQVLLLATSESDSYTSLQVRGRGPRYPSEESSYGAEIHVGVLATDVYST